MIYRVKRNTPGCRCLVDPPSHFLDGRPAVWHARLDALTCGACRERDGSTLTLETHLPPYGCEYVERVDEREERFREAIDHELNSHVHNLARCFIYGGRDCLSVAEQIGLEALREREALACFVEKHFDRLGLKAANGYLTGEDLAGRIRRGDVSPIRASPLK